jgi:hypothetical protein
VIALIPRSQKSARMFCSVISLTLILGYFGVTPQGVFCAEARLPFAAFKADVDLDIEDGEFELMITLTLGAGNNGVDPSAETVSLQVTGGTAAFSVAIPAGSFKKDRSGRFTFQGTINGVRMLASIRPLRNGAFEFEIEGERVNLKGVANPVTVSLTIGDDTGSRAVRAKIE